MSTQKEYWNSVADAKEFTTPMQSAVFCRYINRDAAILDVGCGYGRVLSELHALGFRNLCGIDFSEKLIARGKRQFPYLDLRVMESENIDFPDASLDAVLLCAVLFALHIIVVDHFATRTDGVRLSCLQFFVVGLLLTPPMLLAEGLPSWTSISACAVPLLYAGVMSCGIAYTLQILGQRNFNPTIASLLMSLESTFAVLGGWLLLGEQLSARQLVGCAIMFVAIILAQIPAPKRN